LLLTISCANKEAVPINLNIDGCDSCKMKIADGKFGAELITSKEEYINLMICICMVNYHKENPEVKIHSFYIHDFSQNNVLIPAETAFYIKVVEINSPMHGNIIAVKTKSEAQN
jgi:copper chaperone NosL